MSYSLPPWNTKMSIGFCEGYLYGRPEYVNSFTSLFMTFLGLYMLFGNKYINSVTRLFASSLAITGIGSFGLHYWGTFFWGRMDTFPMIITSYLIMFLSYNVIFHRIFHTELYVYRFLSGLLSFAVMACVFFTIAGRTTSGIEISLYTYFLFPQFLTAISLFLHVFVVSTELVTTTKCKQYGVTGVLSLVVSGLCWVLTEPYCEQHTWVRYVFGHAIWHLGVSYGAFLLATVLVYMYCVYTDKNPIFRTGWFYNMFPLIDCSNC